ncbi:MAG TPA: DUF4390 domain-containing protein [Gammaproteobacteria bacterium]
MTGSSSRPTSRPAAGGMLAWCLGWLLGGLLLPLAVAADPPRFRVVEAATRLVDEVYRLDARLDLEFSAEVFEALDNGVPLTIELQIEVFEPSDWLWDSSVAELSQRYVLEYRALSGQYLVTNVNTDERSSYAGRHAALVAIGRLQGFPMLDHRLLGVGKRYGARIRARLDIEALPLPLRPVAYLSEAWDLASDWHTWLLVP